MKNSLKRYLLVFLVGLAGYAAVILLFLGVVRLIEGPDMKEPGAGIYIGLAVFKLGFIAVSILVAREKGRSMVLWGVIELLFSVVGTLILLFLPHTAERRAELDGRAVSQ